MTKEDLISYGADFEKGMQLCMNNEAFYFKMIQKCLANEKFKTLGEKLTAKDLKAAFEDAHALKGVTGNLALTPLYNAIEQIVEPLRKGEEADYSSLYKKIEEEKAKLDSFAL